MIVVRIIESAILLLFGFAHLLTSFNAAIGDDSVKTVWAGGLLGMLELVLAYNLWL